MDWVDLMRAMTVGYGFFIFGMAVLVIRQYAPVAARTRGALPRHVASIALSYCILLGITMGTQFEFIAKDAEPTWRLFVIPWAYMIGHYALRAILTSIRQRREAGMTRRLSDPA